MNVHWRKLTNERQGKLKPKFVAAFVTIFEIFKEASKNFIFKLLTMLTDILKTICAGTESTYLILLSF
jgi:hypothetical protein